jgi:hypothetical protein
MGAMKDELEGICSKIIGDLKELVKKYGVWIVVGAVALYLYKKLK